MPLNTFCPNCKFELNKNVENQEQGETTVVSIVNSQESSEEQTPRAKQCFTAKQINMIIFTMKQPDDKNSPVDNERCYLCKWCIEPGNYFLELSCKHIIHKKCLEVWFLSNADCPVCKQKQDVRNYMGQMRNIEKQIDS